MNGPALGRRGPGRPRRDQLRLVAEVCALLQADPSLSATACVILLRARKQSVLRAVRLVREAGGRFPNSRDGIEEGGS